MKFRVLFLKKRYIYYSALIILLIILSILFFLSKESLPTFSTIGIGRTIKNYDVTGDGIKDLISIDSINDKYKVNINSKGKNYTLSPNKQLDTLGNHYDYWPLRITFLDISRDKLPEIFTQASERGKAIQHIFVWDKDKFQDILSNTNNLLGFIDLHNNKTPKIISGNIGENDISMANYIFSQDKLIHYSNNYNSNFLGKDSILSFVKYVQGLPQNETEKPNDIFYPGLDGNALSAIGMLSASDSTFTFQDGIFMDNRCNTDGDIIEIKWVLNFKSISNKDTNMVKNYTLNLMLKAQGDPSQKHYFKISSVQISNKNNN
ncbi:hypothetical protein [Clostridium pasteurianum]|uniref:VCBS repeat-containing protein n=1 Tax=Clostridium pasteurianum BC1 TaxID=86416 RepID=R4K0F7_CLOPA|nr:hypothetical protein [Clostridium pasteurianum]AGK96567.1 hypothetical protein Clopa_1641 [Clostridium pasteurianum BC1]